MRKLAFCICENKATDQLHSLCFHYIARTIPLLPKENFFKLIDILCGCTARFVSDLVINPEEFSHNKAHLKGALGK